MEIGNRERERKRHPISDNVWTSGDWKRRRIGIGKKEEQRRTKTNCSRHHTSHTNDESSARLNYCISTIATSIFIIHVIEVATLLE